MPTTDPEENFADIVRSMSSAEGVTDTLALAVEAATDLIPDARWAGVSIMHGRGRIDTPAATGDVPRRGDELQYELGEGPCLQAIRSQETVQSDDLLDEQRWPTWSRRAADELGVRSMLCLQLFVGVDSLGALNLYADRADAFDPADRVTGLALASHVAAAYTSAHQIEGLESAVLNRTVIGQAQGMLMQRFDLTPEQAFSTLTRLSQDSNRKLHEVAADLVNKGFGSTLGA